MEAVNLTPLFNLIIAILSAVALRYLAPWLKERTTAAQREDFAHWVKVAVAAAEQLYAASQGEAKKKYVTAFLEEKGFEVDYEDLNLSIEAAVLALHRGLADE